MELLRINNIKLIEDYLVKRFDENYDPLILSNINYNFKLQSNLINRVILWFSKNSSYPKHVTKILSEENISINENYCKFCKSSNEILNNNFFIEPEIVKYKKIVFLYEEGCKGTNYESDLKNAIIGPEKNLLNYSLILKKQLGEIFKFCELTNKSLISKNIVSWDESFDKIINELKIYCKNKKIISLLQRERISIKGLKSYENIVVPDLVTPNIFYGPKFTDNLVEDITKIHKKIPSEMNFFRFMILYLISPPLKYIVTNPIKFYDIVLDNNITNNSPEIIKIFQKINHNINLTREIKFSLFLFSIAYEFNERFKICFSDKKRLENTVAELEDIFLKYINCKSSNRYLLKKIIFLENQIDKNNFIPDKNYGKINLKRLKNFLLKIFK